VALDAMMIADSAGGWVARASGSAPVAQSQVRLDREIPTEFVSASAAIPANFHQLCRPANSSTLHDNAGGELVDCFCVAAETEAIGTAVVSSKTKAGVRGAREQLSLVRLASLGLPAAALRIAERKRKILSCSPTISLNLEPTDSSACRRLRVCKGASPTLDGGSDGRFGQ